MGTFADSITNLYNSLINRRSAVRNNTVTVSRLDDETLKAIYRTGLGSKIIRLKAGHALKDTLQFESNDDQRFYNARLAKSVKRAAKFMIAFGRGLIVLHEPGADLTRPMRETIDPGRLRLRVFSGDMINVPAVSVDLNDADYLKPKAFHVRGIPIHHTRCIDFKYVEPTELDAGEYRYGGISEFELIYQQIINDGIVERASPAILEKNSSLFYRVAGFKELMMQGKEADMVKYFGKLEDMRCIYGAGLLDLEDEVTALDQTLTNLSQVDQITLRRLAMVTGIPMALLIGENVKGLNSTGDNERQAFQDMIESLQSDYLLEPVNELMRKTDQGVVEFKENQGETPTARVTYEKTAIENAHRLWEMGEDYQAYLKDKDVIKADDFASMFELPDESEAREALAGAFVLGGDDARES